MGVKSVRFPVVREGPYIPVFVFVYIIYTITAHMIFVPLLNPVCIEIVPIETAKPVPCRKPHKTFFILHNTHYGMLRQSIFRPVMFKKTFLLPGNRYTNNENKQKTIETIKNHATKRFCTNIVKTEEGFE
jgi:hypothetical protein